MRYGEYDFWRSQLFGLPQECTPGKPQPGFYSLRVRTTEYAPVLGKRRNKVTETFEPVAIWEDDHGLICIKGSGERTRIIRDIDEIDSIFSRCCRAAIEYDEYERMRANG